MKKLLIAATICLLLGLTWGSSGTYSWGALQVVGTLIAAVVLYAAFFAVERVAVEPILPLDLFRNRVFGVAALLSLLQMIVLVGLVVYLPLFFQTVRQVSATTAGALITPMTVSSVVGAALSGFGVMALKRYRILAIVGALLMTAGVALLTRMTPTTGTTVVLIYLVLTGLGIGPFFSILTIAAQNAIPATRLGVGTSAVRYLGQLGAVLGVAIVGTVINTAFKANASQYVAIQHGFVAVLVFTVAALVASCFLRDLPMTSEEH